MDKCEKAPAIGQPWQPGTANLGKAIDQDEFRLNELGYQEELKQDMTLFKTFTIAFSTVILFTGVEPLLGNSLENASPASLVWGWFAVASFTWFVGLAMAEICSSHPTTGSLYFWAAHLAGPTYGPVSSWTCAWLEVLGLIAAIGGQAYAGSQVLQNILRQDIWTGTNLPNSESYFAPSGAVFLLVVYIALCLTWALLNTFAVDIIAILESVSFYWQVVGGGVIILLLPLVAPRRQSSEACMFTDFEENRVENRTGLQSNAYAVILSFLVSQYSLYGYDAAAHLTVRSTSVGAAMKAPIAMLISIGIITMYGFGFILVLTFSIQDPIDGFGVNNNVKGNIVPAQILYDVFHGRYSNAIGANVILCIIWGSFFFGGLSLTTSAARVVCAVSRDGGIPGSQLWREVHPKYKVPRNAVWLCTACAIVFGISILAIDVVFTTVVSIATIGWVGGYSVPIFCRIFVPNERFQPGPFSLGKLSRPVCVISFLWICFACSKYLLPREYPVTVRTFNFAPVVLGLMLTAVTSWWFVNARKWFKGPLRTMSGFNHSLPVYVDEFSFGMQTGDDLIFFMRAKSTTTNSEI